MHACLHVTALLRLCYATLRCALTLHVMHADCALYHFRQQHSIAHIFLADSRHCLQCHMPCPASWTQCEGTVIVRCSVPREVRLQHAIFPDCAYHLAATCWANAQLEVVPRFPPSLGANMQDHNLDSCFDGCHQTQSGHVNTAIVMPGGSVSQTGFM